EHEAVFIVVSLAALGLYVTANLGHDVVALGDQIDGMRPVLGRKQRKQRFQQLGANLFLSGEAFRPAATAWKPPDIIGMHGRAEDAAVAGLQRLIDAADG